MARYNSALTSNTITGTATIGSPYSGAFTEFTGTAPYTVTLPTPVAFPGVTQTFYNATSGTVTLSTPSGNFVGTGSTGATTIPIYSGNVVSIVSDGSNYVVISEDGSPLIATTGSFSGNVTINGGSATLSVTSSVVTMAPTASSTIDNIAIGATTRASGAFTTLASNNAVTFTANTASSSTTTGSLVVTGGIGASGTVYAGAFNGNLTGTLQTAAQPNITSVGSLTAPGLTVDTTTLVVDATNDRVGVGTAGPGAVLHVVKTVQQTDFDNANQVLQLENTSTDTSGNVSGLRFRQTNGTNAANSFIGLSSTGSSSTRANLIFASPNTSGNATIRMSVNALGQVLIGTASTPYGGATGTGVYINGVSNNQPDLAALFVAGAKIGFAGIQSLIQNQLVVYDNTAGNPAGSGGAIAFGGNAGGGQGTYYAAIESRKDNGTAGAYGASLNFYTRPDGGYYTSPNMTISSSGNVGIGTTASFATIDGYTQRGIEIVGTKESGTAPVIRLRETGSSLGAFEIRSNREGATSGNYLAFGEGTSTFMVLRGDDDGGSTGTRGFVGIGTTSPTSRLQVNNAADSRIIIFETGTTPYTATLELASQAIGTYGALLQYTSSAETLTLKAYGRTVTGTTQGSILFNTKVANTTDTTVMTIHGFSGNVGIGSLSPANKLDVRGTLGIGTGSSATDNAFTFSSVNSSANNHTHTFQGPSNGTNDDLTFNLSRGGGAYGSFTIAFIGSTRLFIAGSTLNNSGHTYITPAANLGVGYTSPSEKLSVNGNITAGNTGHEYRVRGRNQPRLIYTVTPSGSMYSTQSFVWSTLFDTIQSTTSYFDSGTGYMMFLTSSNGAHSYSYKADLRVAGVAYGATANRYRVTNLTNIGGPWEGGCGGSAFSSIDNSGFTYYFNPCYESVAIWIIEYGY